jgi:predicted hydrolase (HD superfamily)
LKWELAGLLHDADWEKYPDDHCGIIIEELEKRNIDPEVIHCIASHGPGYFGVEPNNTMDKMIYAFDELSGFVHAAALIRPTRYEDWKQKVF